MPGKDMTIEWDDSNVRPTMKCLTDGHFPIFDGSDINLVTGEWKVTFHCAHCGAKGTRDAQLARADRT